MGHFALHPSPPACTGIVGLTGAAVCRAAPAPAPAAWVVLGVIRAWRAEKNNPGRCTTEGGVAVAQLGEDGEMGLTSAPFGFPTYAAFCDLVWITLDHLCAEKSRSEPEKLLGSYKI